MTPYVAKGSDGRAREIWEDVGSAARDTPEWVKEQVLRASQEAAKVFEDRREALAKQSR